MLVLTDRDGDDAAAHIGADCHGVGLDIGVIGR